MNRMLKISVLICLSLFSLSTFAEEKKDEAPSDIIQAIEAKLKTGRADIDNLGRLNRRLTTLKAWASECVAEQEKNVSEKKAALETLGEQRKKESPELVKQRKQQEKDLAEVETSLATCSALLLRIQAALEIADTQLQKQLSEQLLAQGDNILDVLGKHAESPVDWIKHTWTYGQKHAWLPSASVNQLWIIAGILFLSIVVGVLIRYFLTPVVLRINWSSEKSGRFAASFMSSFCHDVPFLLASSSMALLFHLFTTGIEPKPIITSFAYGLSFLFIARFVIHFSLAPKPPGSLFLKIKPATATALTRRLKILTVIVFLGYLLVNTLVSASLPGHALSLARAVLAIAFAVNLIWVLWLFGELRGVLRQPWLRYGLSLVLVISVLAILSGYTNLSVWLLRSVFGSLFAIVVILVLGSLTSELLEGLEYGNTSWQRKLRRLLGLTPEGHITGFFWFRLLVNLGWWSLLMLLLIFIWDLSASMVEEIRVIFTSGFTLGSLQIIPARIVFALVSLGVLVTLSAWFQGQMRRRWAKSMPMERGAREAMVTMVGYIGVAIAILVALGITGIDYSHLAIIAGALSLGIGFGLQNIVNNFVSGLILLFERPIKTGDWVVVGNTEGYVKRIRIRATQIQTFDQADVIVPNSELISGQVTNWMLHDPRGRARIPVGVAYGSDTSKVKEILLKVASEHPSIITDGSSPGPKVLFRQFGDSSLDFELRCFISNIDERLSVVSDLNFAIDAAFREQGIEIPFPQRDVHIKGAPSADKKD
jgi:small-conductance mechanosensitive channel